MGQDNRRSHTLPYEPSYEERVRLDRERKWDELSPPLLELARHVALLTGQYRLMGPAR